jgi:hypothetical protein
MRSKVDLTRTAGTFYGTFILFGRMPLGAKNRLISLDLRGTETPGFHCGKSTGERDLLWGW